VRLGVVPDLLNHVVTASGAASGAPVLLLIHPLGGNLHFWDEPVALWRDRVVSVACDLRSAGGSPTSDGPTTIDQHVADLEALRSSLGFDTVVPVGCAVGAMVAAAYAAAHPARIAGLVLSNPAPRITGPAATALTERAAAVQASGLEAILPGAVDAAFLNQARDNRYQRYLERFAAQDPDAYVRAVLGIAGVDIADDLRSIEVPTLVLAGRHDTLLPPDQAREVHRALRNGHFVMVEEAAHFLPLQHPERFSQTVLEFLADIGVG
jgi:3-oxoadipate enol-lactonase